MELRQFIDHTLLKATATPEDIETLCKEAIEHQFYAVCVNSCYTHLVTTQLKFERVLVASVDHLFRSECAWELLGNSSGAM